MQIYWLYRVLLACSLMVGAAGRSILAAVWRIFRIHTLYLPTYCIHIVDIFMYACRNVCGISLYQLVARLLADGGCIGARASSPPLGETIAYNHSLHT